MLYISLRLGHGLRTVRAVIVAGGGGYLPRCSYNSFALRRLSSNRA